MPEKYSLETVQKVYSYWGKSLFFYKWGVSFFGYYRYLTKKAVQSLELKENNLVLDLACGPGLIFTLLQKKIGPEGKLIGVDYVPEMINHCQKQVKKRGWKNVLLLNEDAAKLNLAPNSLDGIISIIGLSAIPDYHKTIELCHRFLKPGGRLVIMDGKNSRSKLINVLLKLFRWSKSYQQTDLIAELKKTFPQISVTEYFLGTAFIAVMVKKYNVGRSSGREK